MLHAVLFGNFRRIRIPLDGIVVGNRKIFDGGCGFPAPTIKTAPMHSNVSDNVLSNILGK